MDELGVHCHHDVLLEIVTSFEKRVEYIRANKPASEIPLRLRLFQLIPPERLPAALGETRDEGRRLWTEGNRLRDEGIAAHMPALLALHAALCPDCPWDGKTIFTHQNQDGTWY